MKALYTLFIAIAVLAVAGCGAKDTALPATKTLPAFSDAGMNDYVKNYAAAANGYVAAMREKNMNKVIGYMGELSNAQEEVRRRVDTLTPEDATKLTDWSRTLNKQVETQIADIKSEM